MNIHRGNGGEDDDCDDDDVNDVNCLQTFELLLTSIFRTSPFQTQPSSQLGHFTTRERASLFIKLSGNNLNENNINEHELAPA